LGFTLCGFVLRSQRPAAHHRRDALLTFLLLGGRAPFPRWGPSRRRDPGLGTFGSRSFIRLQGFPPLANRSAPVALVRHPRPTFPLWVFVSSWSGPPCALQASAQTTATAWRCPGRCRSGPRCISRPNVLGSGPTLASRPSHLEICSLLAPPSFGNKDNLAYGLSPFHLGSPCPSPDRASRFDCLRPRPEPSEPPGWAVLRAERGSYFLGLLRGQDNPISPDNF
jgi:hypothetical protein